jgi:hypothetical protein
MAAAILIALGLGVCVSTGIVLALRLGAVFWPARGKRDAVFARMWQTASPIWAAR